MPLFNAGPFQLIKYRVGKTGSVAELPLYCRPQLLMPAKDEVEGSLSIMIGTKPKTALRATTQRGITVRGPLSLTRFAWHPRLREIMIVVVAPWDALRVG